MKSTNPSPLRRIAGIACLILLLGPLGGRIVAAAPEDEVRATFERLIAAQNAHDENAVADLLVDSPDFLWITRGAAIWGHDPAMNRFSALYQGTWQVSPDLSGLKVIMMGDRVAQLFIPVVFTIGSAGQPA